MKSITWTDHPVIDTLPGYARLDDDQFAELVRLAGPEAAVKYWKQREERIRAAERDPLNHEFHLPHWRDAEALLARKSVLFVPGGNNPGKSFWSGSLVVRTLLRKFVWPEQRSGDVQILMIAQDDLASKMFQQPAVFSHLPVEWRNMNEADVKSKGWKRRISYSRKNGFTDDNFVLPTPDPWPVLVPHCGAVYSRPALV